MVFSGPFFASSKLHTFVPNLFKTPQKMTLQALSSTETVKIHTILYFIVKHYSFCEIFLNLMIFQFRVRGSTTLRSFQAKVSRFTVFMCFSSQKLAGNCPKSSRLRRSSHGFDSLKLLISGKLSDPKRGSFELDKKHIKCSKPKLHTK